jgi:hypothetical protein
LCVVWIVHESNKLHGRVSAIKCVLQTDSTQSSIYAIASTNRISAR